MNKIIVKILCLCMVSSISGCKASASPKEEIKRSSDCGKTETPRALVSPQPTPWPIPEHWKHKSSDEIYQAIVSHPCNPKLVNDEITIKGYGRGPVSPTLTKAKKLDVATRAATADAYRRAAEMLLDIYVDTHLTVKSFVYSPDKERSGAVRSKTSQYIKNAEKASEKITDETNIDVEVELKLIDFYKTIAQIISY